MQEAQELYTKALDGCCALNQMKLPVDVPSVDDNGIGVIGHYVVSLGRPDP